jgi:acyl dehydratase
VLCVKCPYRMLRYPYRMLPCGLRHARTGRYPYRVRGADCARPRADRMTNTEFNPPAEERYFEDYVPGSVYEFGSIVMEEKEMIEFATRYDPQPFHIDPEAARKGVFGGLIASGWHTGAASMRLIVDHYLSRVASLGSLGVDELRWLKPVRPGDELSIRVTVLETRLSQSKPDRGIVRSLVEVMNQIGEVVMSRMAVNIVGCRNAT